MIVDDTRRANPRRDVLKPKMKLIFALAPCEFIVVKGKSVVFGTKKFITLIQFG